MSRLFDAPKNRWDIGRSDNTNKCLGICDVCNKKTKEIPHVLSLCRTHDQNRSSASEAGEMFT